MLYYMCKFFEYKLEEKMFKNLNIEKIWAIVMIAVLALATALLIALVESLFRK